MKLVNVIRAIDLHSITFKHNGDLKEHIANTHTLTKQFQ